MAWQSACTTAHGWGLPPSPAGRDWRGVGDAECAGRGHGACPLLIRRRGGGRGGRRTHAPAFPLSVACALGAPRPRPRRAGHRGGGGGWGCGWGGVTRTCFRVLGRGAESEEARRARSGACVRDCAFVSSLSSNFFFCSPLHPALALARPEGADPAFSPDRCACPSPHLLSARRSRRVVKRAHARAPTRRERDKAYTFVLFFRCRAVSRCAGGWGGTPARPRRDRRDRQPRRPIVCVPWWKGT